VLFFSHWAALVYKYLHLAAGCSCTGITCDLWLWLVPELWINLTLVNLGEEVPVVVEYIKDLVTVTSLC